MTIKTDIALYKRLLNYVLPYRRIFLISIISMVVLAVTAPAKAALIQLLLNGAFIEQDPNIMALFPFLFIAVFVISGVASYIGITALHWVSNKIIMDLRLLMFERAINYPNQFFDNNRAGHFMSQFTYDVSQLKDCSTSVLLILVRDAFSVIGLLGWMLYINWGLTLICMIGAPIIIVFVSIIRKRLRKMSLKIQATMGDIHHVLNECFDAQKIIKIYAGQPTETQRFFNAANEHRHFTMKFIMATSATSPFLQIITAIILAIIIHIATGKISANPLLIGDFVSFFTAAFMLITPLKRLIGINEYLQKGLAACESVFAAIDAEIEPQSGTKILVEAKGKIVFKGVSYQYPHAQKPALKDITFAMQPGQTVALVGKSGSGKTTLANLLPRFYEAQQGTIYYDDIDICTLSLASLRKNIAYVSQDIILFNDSIRNNIAYGDLQAVSDEAIWAAAEAACATEFITAMPDKLSSLIGESGIRLSGGQRQRLAIARALLKDARLLILDEATSSLDTQSEKHIQFALENLKKDRSCLIIAHRMSTIENADHIIVLEQGKIVEQGAHDELLNQQKHYAKLHKMQFKTL